MKFVNRAQALAACALVAVSLACHIGCTPSAQSLALDKNVARKSLQTFLETWQQGGDSKALQTKSPSIIGRDPDWDGGRKLTQFALGEETDDGTNLHVVVTLTLDGDEAKSAKTTYVVGTSPVITIQRGD